jgi:hypothetical protein
MELRWKYCAGMTIIQLEPGGDCYKVTHPQKMLSKLSMLLKYKRNNVRVGCGKILVFHAMAYYSKTKKTLQEIMASDAVSDFHKYPFYHELMKRNINPVVMDTLIASKEETCLPLDVVVKQPGNPKTKQL